MSKISFKKYLNINSLIMFVIVPTALLVLYAGTFTYIYPDLIPKGVNYVFSHRLLKYSLIIFLLECLAALLIMNIKQPDELNIKLPKTKPSFVDLVLLLIPLSTLVQYVLNNTDSLSFVGSILFILFFLLFSGLFVFVLPTLLGVLSSPRILMSLGMAFVYTLINMASLSYQFSWLNFGSLKIQLLFYGLIFLITLILLHLKNKRDLFVLVCIYFIASIIFQIIPQNNVDSEQAATSIEQGLPAFVAGKTPQLTPNIYLLVYEAYVANETMMAYGIDNSQQEAYLHELDFELYTQTYTIGPYTLASMSRLLNASSSYHGRTRKGVSGHGIVHNIFRDIGYKTYGIFPNDFMFRDNESGYDYSIPGKALPSYAYLISSVLMGEFRFDLFDIGYSELSYEKYIEEKHNIFTNFTPDPIFMYTHSKFPGHSQNSGTCLPDEIDLYEEGLREANLEMRNDVELITQNDPEAIIIIAGDHGPYLTKNCTTTSGVYDKSEISRLDVQDRYGSFLAVKWPTEDYKHLDEITVLQDLFPVIFAYLYDNDDFLKFKVDPVILHNSSVSEVSVENCVIQGGTHDGEYLFEACSSTHDE